jgi:hypothetical protein
MQNAPPPDDGPWRGDEVHNERYEEHLCPEEPSRREPACETGMVVLENPETTKMTRSEYARREEAAKLVKYVTNSLRWRPTIRDGAAVFDIGSDIAITAETVAAIAHEDGVLGRGLVVPHRVAHDAATTLRGLAALNAAAGGVR